MHHILLQRSQKKSSAGSKGTVMGEQTQFATHFHTFLRRAHFIIDENRA